MTTEVVLPHVKNEYVPISEKIYDIDCGIGLQDWIIENECVSYEILNKIIMGETFRDQDGVLRFVSNWFPAPEIVDDVQIDAYVRYRQHFASTGCFEIPVAVARKSNVIETNSSDNNHVATIKILSNWERLWNHLSTDSSDEIANQVPILRACVNFFMHKCTFLLFLVLFVYNESLQAWISVELSVAPIEAAVQFIYKLCTVMLYFIMYRLYNTKRSVKISKDQSDRDDHDNALPLEYGYRKKLENIRSNVAIAKYVTNMHWSGSVRQLIALIKVEIRSLFHGTSSPQHKSAESPESANNGSSSHSREESLHSFDMLLNIALKYLTRHCGVRHDELNLSRLGYRIAFLTIFTILPIICILQMAYSWFVTFKLCQFYGSGSSNCRSSIIYTVLAAGYITTGLSTFLFFGAQIISMIGLMYGSELAYRMIGCWMKRFASLRRVAYNDNEDVEASASNQHLVSPVTALNRESNSLVIKEISYISMREFSTQITRDATEQYLFMVEYMRQSGSVWSSVIVGLYIYSIMLTTVTVYIYIVYQSQIPLSALIEGIVFICAELLLYLVFPAWSVAHANSFLSPMLDLFMNSAKEDFTLIGACFHVFFFFYFLLVLVVIVVVVVEMKL